MLTVSPVNVFCTAYGAALTAHIHIDCRPLSVGLETPILCPIHVIRPYLDKRQLIRPALAYRTGVSDHVRAPLSVQCRHYRADRKICHFSVGAAADSAAWCPGFLFGSDAPMVVHVHQVTSSRSVGSGPGPVFDWSGPGPDRSGLGPSPVGGQVWSRPDFPIQSRPDLPIGQVRVHSGFPIGQVRPPDQSGPGPFWLLNRSGPVSRSVRSGTRSGLPIGRVRSRSSIRLVGSGSRSVGSSPGLTSRSVQSGSGAGTSPPVVGCGTGI